MPLKKYFAEATTEELSVEFEWVGEPQTLSRLPVYKECKINGKPVKVGDDVAIRQEEGHPYAVGSVQRLNEEINSENPNRAIIQWYYALRELPKNMQTTWKKLTGESSCSSPCELIEMESTHTIEDIDAETIVGSCEVINVHTDHCIPAELENGRYYVRFRAVDRRLLPIYQDENIEKKKADLLRKTIAITSPTVHIDNFSPVKHLSKTPSAARKKKSAAKTPKDSKTSQIVCSSVPAKLKASSKPRAPLKPVANNKESVVSSTKRKSSVSSNNSVESSKKPKKQTKGKTTTSKSKVLSTNDILAGLDQDDEELSDLESEASSVCSSTSSRSSSRRIEIPVDEDVSFIRTIPCLHPKLTPKFTGVQEKSSKTTPKKGAKQSSKITKDENDYDEDPDFSKEEDDDLNDEDYISEKSVESEKEDFSFDEDHEDFNLKKTPKRKRSRKICMPKSTSKSTKKTPKLKRRDTMTPSIGKRSVAKLEAKSPLQKARLKLHVSAVPDCLPCRENEFTDILTYVSSHLQSHTGGCMYISGVPGTGKTATVHEVIRTLNEDYADDLPPFKFVELNGMKLTDPNQVYPALLKQLTGERATADHAYDLLEKKFNSNIAKKEHVVVLVDELDLLWTRKQKVMYNLFDWPTKKHSRLVILAVANTMDLPERVMINRVSSRLGLTRMTFQPYNFRQLQEIVLSRISGIEAFEEHALQLVARKVAAVSGDARRCLDICRRAVEIADAMSGAKAKVGMFHVDRALKEMFSSPKILALQNLSEMETLFMKAIISEFRRTGLEEALFFEVFDQFRSHCQLEGGYSALNTTEALAICTSLAASRFILREPGHRDIYQRVRLNINTDDILFAFKSKDKS